MEEAVFEPRERGGRDGEGIDEIWGLKEDLCC